MKNRIFLCLIILAVSFPATGFAQQKVYPLLKGFGGIYPIPEATKKPDPSLDYRIVVELKSGAPAKKDIVPGLNQIARVINLHGLGGIPKEKLHIVAVVHAEATPLVLSNEAYRNHYGTDNPNMKILKALSDFGVEFYVCGQSLIARGFATSELGTIPALSISAITVLTEYQLKGYAVLQY